ncbi:DUF397 domain-containing protein [Streptomyces sp. Amel2xC10]|uniref:DUF397 domain-containing protein n=1 Tax=Streptomyces sp. Amel2xC10 TaxID=1305826 RepID=UPI003561B344
MDQEQLQRPQQQLHGIPYPPAGKAVVRDSKEPHHRMIVFGAESWTQFVRAYRVGALASSG